MSRRHTGVASRSMTEPDVPDYIQELADMINEPIKELKDLRAEVAALTARVSELEQLRTLP